MNIDNTQPDITQINRELLMYRKELDKLRNRASRVEHEIKVTRSIIKALEAEARPELVVAPVVPDWE